MWLKQMTSHNVQNKKASSIVKVSHLLSLQAILDSLNSKGIENLLEQSRTAFLTYTADRTRALVWINHKFELSDL